VKKVMDEERPTRMASQFIIPKHKKRQTSILQTQKALVSGFTGDNACFSGDTPKKYL